MTAHKIALTVIVATLNEERNLPRCLAALERFDEVIVVDSKSADATRGIAQSFGAQIVDFVWNGRYPKKRQWCLDHLRLRHNHVFFVDADEEVTAPLCDEIAALDWACDAYFVKGAYVINGNVLRFGLKNKKLCLFDRRAVQFPVVDDLDIAGMGEIEGHYQPVLKDVESSRIGALRNALRHHAFDDHDRWNERHEGYSQWHKGVLSKSRLPRDPDKVRHLMKTVFYKMPGRAAAAFLHSYLLLGGVLDGKEGLGLALSRYRYYALNAALPPDPDIKSGSRRAH